MPQLNRKNANKPKTLPLKVMQFGGGNFLRAFVDEMIQELNDTTDFNGGVVIVKPTESGEYEYLRAQEGLFTVVLDGVNNHQLITKRTLVSCVQEILNPYTQWNEYLKLARNSDIRFVVSNTTEAGIQFNTQDTFTDKPANEFPAKLTRWLFERFTFFKGDISKGVIFLPCELIENNGDVLKKTILEYAELWKIGVGFMNWVYTANYFCNTLVDRIVSGYPSDRVASLTEKLGYDDQLLVAGEYYHSWVIQGPKIVQEEIPFKKTTLNVEFVNDLKPYREMKVRILNGAHTAMVPVGYLAGFRLVKEVMDDEDIARFIAKLLSKEVGETINMTTPILDKFIEDVLDRFKNPLLKHQLLSISLNSTSKFVTRLLPTFKEYYVKERKLPKQIVFAFSALIVFYRGTFRKRKIVVPDSELVIGFFELNWKKYQAKELSTTVFVGIILSNAAIWGEDLNRYEGLAEMVAYNILSIDSLGVKKTLVNLNEDY